MPKSLQMREQWFCNNGFQEVVTSIHFVKIKQLNKSFAKRLGFEPRLAGSAKTFSPVL